MTAGLASDRDLRASCWWRSRRCSAATWRACTPGETRVPERVFGRFERLLYRGFGVDAVARARTGSATRESLIVFSLAGWLLMYVILRTQTIQPLSSYGGRHLPRRAVGRDVQHGVVVRDEHELAVLRRRDDADVLQPDGRADGRRTSSPPPSGSSSLIALIRGIIARSGSSLGNFWQDLVRTVALRPAAARRSIGTLLLVSQGVIQNISPTTPRRTRSRAARRRSRRARSPRRSRSSSSAPTAAASSTPTRRIRSRTRPAFSNFVEMLFIDPDPRRADVHVRADGRLAAARRWAIFAAMFVMCDRRWSPSPTRPSSTARPRSTRPACTTHGDRRLDRRQHGGQGAALRDRQLGAVGDDARRSPPTARSTARSSRSPAWAAPCRWPTCRPAR